MQNLSTSSSSSSSPSLSPSPATPATPYKIPLMHKLVVGGIAGLVGVSATFPLDVIKTQLQAPPKAVASSSVKAATPSIFQVTRSILTTYGVRGLYHGLPPTAVGILPEKAIKLAFNDFFREKFEQLDGSITFFHQLIASGLAGTMQVIATNPMEIIKIRLQTNANRNTLEALKDLGLSGMYRGTTSTLSRDVPYAMMFFPGYAYLKDAISAYMTKDADPLKPVEPPMGGILLAGGLAGAGASAFVTPMDVVKTRRQVKGSIHTSGIACCKHVIKNEGIQALFHGALPRMFVQAPLFAITLLAFELQKKYMQKQYGSETENVHSYSTLPSMYNNEEDETIE